MPTEHQLAEELAVAKKPRRLTAKQENFAQLLANGGDLCASYCEAYDTNASVNSSTVKTNSSKAARHLGVAARITELKAELEKGKQKVSKLSPAWVLEKLQNEAGDTKNGTATSRIRALELIGKAKGMFNDDLTVIVKDRSSNEIKDQLLEALGALVGASEAVKLLEAPAPVAHEVLEGTPVPEQENDMSDEE